MVRGDANSLMKKRNKYKTSWRNDWMEPQAVPTHADIHGKYQL
jgi:hypothetical protein